MQHETTFTSGTDARNHVFRCFCGWAYSGTNLDIWQRARVHRTHFVDESRRWNDPRRQTEMPPKFQRAVS